MKDDIIATASWDRTYKFWNATTGECTRTIGPTAGQNWSGLFLPDGKHILLSGGNGPTPLSVYDIKTGNLVNSFNPAGTKLNHWVRYFAGHPSEDCVVVQDAGKLLAWQPLASASGENAVTVSQEIFAFAKGEEEDIKHRFANVSDMDWSRDGRYLICTGSEHSTFVWEKERGTKWRFQRQKSRASGTGTGHAVVLKRNGADWIAAASGDGVVRLWKL